MLHGEFHIPQKKEKIKQLVLEFTFDDTRLVVTDWQKQANATLDPEPSEVPDVLSPQSTTRYLKKIMESPKEIKALLRYQASCVDWEMLIPMRDIPILNTGVFLMITCQF